MAATEDSRERVLQFRGITIRSAREGADRVVTLDGELELASAAAVADELLLAEAGGGERIVVDMRSLSFVDSTGIHVLTSAHMRCAAQGRKLVVRLADGPVRRVLAVCGALDILVPADDEEAVAA